MLTELRQWPPLDLAQQAQQRKFGELLSEPSGVSRRNHAEADGCRTDRRGLRLRQEASSASITWWISRSIDNYGDDPRFTVVYHLYGYGHRCYLRLKTDVSEEKSGAADRHDGLAHGGLARARNLRHDGHSFSRPSRPAPHFDVGRLSLFSVAQRFSAGGQADATCRKWLSPNRRRWKAARS